MPETFDIADSRTDGQGTVQADAGHCLEEACPLVVFRSGGDLLVHTFEVLVEHFPLLKQLVYFQSVDFTERHFGEPLAYLLRLEELCGAFLFQVVFPEHSVEGIEDGCPFLGQYFSQSRQLAILGFFGTGQVDPSHAGCSLASGEALPVDPEQVAQERGVAPVGFLLRFVFRLGDDDLSATVFLKHVDQPGVHATDFHDRHEAAFVGRSLRQIGEERPDLLPFRADLTLEEDGSVFRAKIDGELASVLVDTEV